MSNKSAIPPSWSENQDENRLAYHSTFTHGAVTSCLLAYHRSPATFLTNHAEAVVPCHNNCTFKGEQTIYTDCFVCFICFRTTMEELQRKKISRKGFRSHLTCLIKKVDTIIDSESTPNERDIATLTSSIEPFNERNIIETNGLRDCQHNHR